MIGEPKHLVFVIAEGFGMNFVNTLPKSRSGMQGRVSQLNTIDSLEDSMKNTASSCYFLA
jgi:hypothetical protein